MDPAPKVTTEQPGPGLLGRLRAALNALLALEQHEMSRAQAALVYLIKLIRETWRELKNDNCFMRANALAYKTVLGLIPALAIFVAGLAIASANPAEAEKVFTGIVKGLYPVNVEAVTGTGREALSADQRQILASFKAFTANAGKVGAVGFAILAVIVVFLMRTVEESFNAIWGVRQSRPFFSQLAIYTAILFWGPLLAIASITFTQYVHATSAMRHIRQVPWLQSMLLVYFVPYVVAFLAISAIYIWLPNTRVRIRPALAGGALAALLFEMCKHGFTYYVANAASYSKVYGPLAVIPVMLVWFYLSWVFVLSGAEVAFTIQNFEDLTLKQDRLARAERWRLYYAVRAVLEISSRFARGEPPPTATELAEQFQLPEYVMLESLGRLARRGVLTRTQGPEATFVPAKDLDALTVGDVVIATTGTDLQAPDGRTGDPEQALIAEIFDRARHATRTNLSTRFKALVDRAAASGLSPGAPRVVAPRATPPPGEPADLTEPTDLADKADETPEPTADVERRV